MTQVDVGEVQANVLYGYGADYGHALYLRLKLKPGERARDALAGWNRVISFGLGRRRPVSAHVNVAVTARGLRRMQIPYELIDTFPEDFLRGARRRAEALGDTWHNDPLPEWRECDVLVSIVGRSGAACLAQKKALQLNGAFELVGERRAAAKREPTGTARDRDELVHESFGFADGRSQPAIEGVDLDPVGDGVYAGEHPISGHWRRKLSLMAENFGLKPIERSWRLIRPGEFLLGYENEDGVLPEGPPPPLGPNGTFMVYREIDQYPDVFNTYVAERAARVGLSEDELGAKIVGRWKDGTPVGREREESDIATSRRRANDFRYEDDAYGYGCPLGAHVRRANPRDALPGGAERTMRHRIIRRGMPYGSDDDHEQQGLAFICFSASIANGFEFIQREWINRGDAFGLGRQPDFLLQQPDPATKKPAGKLVIQGARQIVLDPPKKPFVRVRGCEYLFVPSRSALTWLSQLAPAR
jgi:Dyp-type peroxidase family